MCLLVICIGEVNRYDYVISLIPSRPLRIFISCCISSYFELQIPHCELLNAPVGQWLANPTMHSTKDVYEWQSFSTHHNSSKTSRSSLECLLLLPFVSEYSCILYIVKLIVPGLSYLPLPSMSENLCTHYKCIDG